MKPVEERGIYAIYVKSDVDALEVRYAQLKAEWAEVVHENAKLSEKLNRYERRAAYTSASGDKWDIHEL